MRHCHDCCDRTGARLDVVTCPDMTPDRALVATVRKGLAELADPVRAPGMQAYMKSTMPYLGVATPERRRLLRFLFDSHPVDDRTSWEATVLDLWREASFREERYAAIELSGHRRYRGWQDPDLVPVYDEIIVTGAWWDYVDEIAIRRIGPILRTHSVVMRPMLLRWSRDVDQWRRRTSVICQVGAKQATDVELLAACIEANLDDRDFFLRKGIGWALRDYARTDPAWVQRLVAQHADRISGLSRREALKHVPATIPMSEELRGVRETQGG